MAFTRCHTLVDLTGRRVDIGFPPDLTRVWQFPSVDVFDPNPPLRAPLAPGTLKRLAPGPDSSTFLAAPPITERASGNSPYGSQLDLFTPHNIFLDNAMLSQGNAE
ncbi:LOW QUALITY PROTEIN: hypothetical protein ElyMa_005718300 [Elysia marginata]|uniref:Uncharacterized protein n=1 Tax=Elysia marginata TaxID=1093978 RepID=A0AAV4FHY1_9GAST|nr:LOW QUALITY PROTEIN: hypothetical protein ElyMa_005718300 [Elysia marginata]